MLPMTDLLLVVKNPPPHRCKRGSPRLSMRGKIRARLCYVFQKIDLKYARFKKGVSQPFQ